MSLVPDSDEASGLYPVSEQMPCDPNQISIWHYALPSTLERAEREEAAARLLVFSQCSGEWVGVSWARIGQVCLADLDAYETAQEAHDARRKERARIERSNRWRALFNFFTRGWYGRRYPEETEKEPTSPALEYPMSGIYFFGPRHITTGFMELRERQMVRIERIGDHDVIYPTAKLIQQIMKVQGVSMAVH